MLNLNRRALGLGASGSSRRLFVDFSFLTNFISQLNPCPASDVELKTMEQKRLETLRALYRAVHIRGYLRQ